MAQLLPLETNWERGSRVNTDAGIRIQNITPNNKLIYAIQDLNDGTGTSAYNNFRKYNTSWQI